MKKLTDKELKKFAEKNYPEIEKTVNNIKNSVKKKDCNTCKTKNPYDCFGCENY